MFSILKNTVTSLGLYGLLLFLPHTLYSAELIAEAEAEDGVLIGVTLSSSKPGYSGRGYVSGFDSSADQVTVTMLVPESGFYALKVRYSAGGDKFQDILINGKPESTVDFPASDAFRRSDAGVYSLKEGSNTLTLKSNWGWILLDRFELYTTDPNPHSFQLASGLVDGEAIHQAKSLYEFLKLQFGQRIIAGQTSSYFDELTTLAGREPMLRAGDLSSYTEGYPYAWNGGHTLGAVDDGTVSQLIDWYRSSAGKGIVSLQWHWHSPAGGDPGNNNFYTEFTDFDIRQAIIPGTAEYDLIIRDVDAIAVQLRRFEEEGIPVLWRPLHEAGGGWFWWGAYGPEPCMELYDILFKRLKDHHGLHHLIWVWSSPETEWYPGNAKVDLIGYDSYPGSHNYSAQRYWFDRLYDLTGGEKLIAMTENGPIPDPEECFQAQAPWLYFMSWSDLVAEQNSIEHIQKVYGQDEVLHLESTQAIRSETWRSSLYPEGWTPGTRDAQGRFLHDFSYAGYHQGEDPVPHITESKTDVTLAPYFADHTGNSDVTAVIQQALEDVGRSGGGVVYLPPGTYRIRQTSNPTVSNAALHIRHDHTVLRGAGPDSTFLFHDQPNLRQKDIIHIRKEWSDWFTPAGNSTRIGADLIQPGKVIPVESVSGFETGDLVVLRSLATPAFNEEHGMGEIWTESAVGGVAFLRRIDSIDEQRHLLILDAPTRYPLKTRDDARVYHAKGHIRECGIENLSIANLENPKSGWGEEDYKLSGTGAYEAHYSHAIQFKYAQDCWVRKVHTYKPASNSGENHLLSNCLLIYMSRNITVDSCNFQYPQYEGGGGNGYMYTLAGNDCLVKNSRGHHSRHNYDFKYPFSNGNVILNCRGEHPKYSTDYHMYLSMANLIDGFVSNGDYLEASFRPWGGTAIHGYAATQSVFYNTTGEAYHPDRDYLILSKQWGWGYVIGTSGQADQVITDPVSGVAGGYTYNTSPRDFVEGVGRGAGLVPTSLYQDQLEKRLARSQDLLRQFDVNVEVLDSKSGEGVANALVHIYGDSLFSSGDGKVTFKGVPELFSLNISKSFYKPFSERILQIYSDTTLTFFLDPGEFMVSFELVDQHTLNQLWGVNVTLGDQTAVSDEQGKASLRVPMGLHEYTLDKPSYMQQSGSLEINSDSLLSFQLERSHAQVKFRLSRESTPIHNALVTLNEESLISDNMGMARFSDQLVQKTYTYTVSKEAYQALYGTFLLSKDTTLQLEMIPESLTGIRNKKMGMELWPNPTEGIIHMSLPFSTFSGLVQIRDLYGRVWLSFPLNGTTSSIHLETCPPGVYLVTIWSDQKVFQQLVLKQ